MEGGGEGGGGGKTWSWVCPPQASWVNLQAEASVPPWLLLIIRAELFREAGELLFYERGVRLISLIGFPAPH